MDFQTSVNLGYYFDRCIDLDFYDSDRNLMGSLYTPSKGIKPSITVKGTLIEGSYAISSYISIQNMSYDININEVSYIKCRMYYSGIEESSAVSESTAKLKNGHTILFSVLYADQEKEPPNRAVRFQCTTAAFDYTRSATPLKISYSAKKLITWSGSEESKNVKIMGSGGKSGNERFFIDVLVNLAECYNEMLKSNGEGDVKKLNLSDNLLITSVKYPGSLELSQIKLEETIHTTIGGLLKKLNNIKPLSSGATCRVFIYEGSIIVEKVPPDNWKEIAMQNGATDLQEFFYLNYLQDDLRCKGVGGAVPNLETAENAVPLNFVKGAYRNETVVNVSTIFDDRIYPGCYCKIKGNAIMGKHRGGGKKAESRITNYTDVEVVFRVTGGIEYEFSTVLGSNMTLAGPVVSEKKG